MRKSLIWIDARLGSTLTQWQIFLEDCGAIRLRHYPPTNVSLFHGRLKHRY